MDVDVEFGSDEERLDRADRESSESRMLKKRRRRVLRQGFPRMMRVFSLEEDVVMVVEGPGVRCCVESSSDSSEDMHSNWRAPVNVGWAKTSTFCRASVRLFSFCYSMQTER